MKPQKRTRPRDARDNCDPRPSSKRPIPERVLIPPFIIKDPDQQEAIYYSKPWGRRGSVSVNGVADRLERIASLAAENPKDKRLLQQDFFRLIVTAVKRLNYLARRNPEQWRWLARAVPDVAGSALRPSKRLGKGDGTHQRAWCGQRRVATSLSRGEVEWR